MNEQDSNMSANAVCHAALMVQYSIQQMVAQYELPSAIYKPKVFPDGGMWCALYGDNIQEGVCGFGETPASAVHAFNNIWNGIKND